MDAKIKNLENEIRRMKSEKAREEKYNRLKHQHFELKHRKSLGIIRGLGKGFSGIGKGYGKSGFNPNNLLKVIGKI